MPSIWWNQQGTRTMTNMTSNDPTPTNDRQRLATRLLAVLAALALFAVGCGGGDADDTASLTDAEAAVEVAATEVPPTAVPEPTAEPEPTATDVPPTPEPEPTATEVPPSPTPEPEPTAEPTPEPEPTEVPPTAEPEPTEVPPTVEPEPTAEPVAETEPEPTAEPEAVVVAVDGGAVYQANCSGCHGASGEGGTSRSIAGIGQLLAANPDALTGLVTNGGVNMPAFGSKLSPEEIDAVVTWVINNI